MWTQWQRWREGGREGKRTFKARAGDDLESTLRINGKKTDQGAQFSLMSDRSFFPFAIVERKKPSNLEDSAAFDFSVRRRVFGRSFAIPSGHFISRKKG